jgi:hypothetical protein
VSHADEAIGLARRIGHPFSEAVALAYASMLHQLRLDVDAMLSSAHAVIALCDRYNIAHYYADWAWVLLGWARGHDDAATGLEAIDAALARLDSRRERAWRPYHLLLLAETYHRAGRPGDALSTLDTAVATAIDRPDVWCLPALYLQKSMLMPAPRAEAFRRQALDLARQHGNRALERRILGSDRTLRRTIRERSSS